MSIKKDITNQRNHFALKNLSSQSYGFSSCSVQMWELDYKDGRAPKNWCFWTVEKSLESPLDCQEINRDGWMASLTQWTWVWANSGWWWRTESRHAIQSMDPQRVGLKDLATEQQFLISSCFNWLFQWTYLQQRLVELVKKASSLLTFWEN